MVAIPGQRLELAGLVQKLHLGRRRKAVHHSAAIVGRKVVGLLLGGCWIDLSADFDNGNDELGFVSQIGVLVTALPHMRTGLCRGVLLVLRAGFLLAVDALKLTETLLERRTQVVRYV